MKPLIPKVEHFWQKLFMTIGVVILASYLMFSCGVTTNRDVATVANTQWIHGETIVAFETETGFISTDDTVISFTFDEKKGNILAETGEEQHLEFVHLKGNRLFFVSENAYYTLYEEASLG